MYLCVCMYVCARYGCWCPWRQKWVSDPCDWSYCWLWVGCGCCNCWASFPALCCSGSYDTLVLASPDVSWCTASLSILCLAPLIGWTRRRNRATQITDTHPSPVTPPENICCKCRIILFMRWTRTFSARIVNYFHSWHTESTHCLSCSLLKLLNSLS